ncbi:hypothetical protein M6B38_185585 [Iris pallida]|uniref:Uncharacterized protein n=1 Tax=Iris pallida TaxID=29817 RepID=A0AAX6EJ24_IRIPA|nr:hypothetical protein M6B38_185585 [Iris pallida]
MASMTGPRSLAETFSRVLLGSV